MNKLFVVECESINWFSKSGSPSVSFDTVQDAVEPFDNPKYQTYDIWSSQAKEVESKALSTISSKEVDEIFSFTTDRLADSVRRGLDRYFERREVRTENMKINADLGLWPEIVDIVLRDLCWANVEYEIDNPGFFMRLVPIYKKGYWPCGWSGEYPDGRYAVL